MRIVLKLPEPTAHWIGLANLIEQSDGLRADITLVIDSNGPRFFEQIATDNPIPVFLREQPRFAVETLAGKLGFLQWLHDAFPKPAPIPATSQRRLQFPAIFQTSGAARRAIRFQAVSS
jgi:hypothetical protein